MNTEDTEYFQNELTQLRSRIIGRAMHRMEPDERVGADGVPDHADYAADKAKVGVSDQVAGSEANLLEKIDLAFARLEDGTYHQCADCGAEIPMERLKAKPTVSLCVGCQEKKEAE